MSRPAEAATARMPGSLLGMTLFVSSEVMFFAALFASYFLLRGTTAPWPPDDTIEASLVLPLLLTGCLLASSVTVHRGAAAVHEGRRRDAGRWLGATIALGVVFLAGQLYEYSELASEGFAASTDVFSTLFFTITGFHGLHVAVGLAMLVTVFLRLDGHGGRGPVEAAAYYWHFVDAVWLLVFVTMYVLR